MRDETSGAVGRSRGPGASGAVVRSGGGGVVVRDERSGAVGRSRALSGALRPVFSSHRSVTRGDSITIANA